MNKIAIEYEMLQRFEEFPDFETFPTNSIAKYRNVPNIDNFGSFINDLKKRDLSYYYFYLIIYEFTDDMMLSIIELDIYFYKFQLYFKTFTLSK